MRLKLRLTCITTWLHIQQLGLLALTKQHTCEKNVIVTIELMKALLMKGLLMKATVSNIKKTFIWLKKTSIEEADYFDRIPISMFRFQTPVSISSLFYMPWFVS